MFTHILVPTDLTPLSDAALTYAKTLARTFGGTVHLLHVLPNVFLRPVVSDPRALEASARKQLQCHLTDAENEQLHVVTAVGRSDEPVDEIVSYARLHDIDLIVLGTHGRRRGAHLLMRSITEKVIRTAPCPVLTVRGDDTHALEGGSDVRTHTRTDRFQPAV